MSTRQRRAFLHLLAAVIAINIGLRLPGGVYRNVVLPAQVRVREAQLRSQLRLLRKQIDQYTADRQHAPQSLDALVASGYLRAVPVDPMTGSSMTWAVVLEDDPLARSRTRGIVDVRSGSYKVDSSGTQRYGKW